MDTSRDLLTLMGHQSQRLGYCRGTLRAIRALAADNLPRTGARDEIIRMVDLAMSETEWSPSPRPEVLPVTSGDDAVPASDQNAASPGDAGGADLCPGCGIPIHDVKSCDAVHCGVWGEE
jgi:hypothetical protein